MKDKYIDSRNIFFEKYNETRTVFLDNSDQEKLDFFSFYYDQAYKKHFSSVSLNSKILDLGCNKGYLLKTLLDKGYTHLTGVDLSMGDIKIAQKLLPEAVFVEDDIFNFLATTHEYFDVICLKAVIEHIEKSRVVELLQLMASRLTENGFVFIDVYNADWLFSHHDRYMDFTHETGFTKESLYQVMIYAFKDVDVSSVASPIKVFNPSPFIIFRRLEKYEYKIWRVIVKYVVGVIEPEMRDTPFLDRYLIAKGKRK